MIEIENSKSVVIAVPDNSPENILRAALTLPRPSEGSVCAVPDSMLLPYAGRYWYACIRATVPGNERHLISTGMSPLSEMGEIDEIAFENSSDEFPSFLANLESNWTLRRDLEFASIGLPLLKLKMANYEKHQKGTTDAKRNDRSRSSRVSQLLAHFDEEEQNNICDQILGYYLSEVLSERTGVDLYSNEDIVHDPDFFLDYMKELFCSGPVRIEGFISGPIGYDRGELVDTFYLEVDLSLAHPQYHMYPAKFTQEQRDRAQFAEYKGRHT